MYAGTYACRQNSGDGFDEIYKTLSGELDLYVGAFCYFESGFGDLGTYHQYGIGPVFTKADESVVLIWPTIKNDGGTFYWGLRYATNGGVINYVWSAVPLVYNQWYWVEMHLVIGNGTGSASLKVDGIVIASVAGLTNDDYTLDRAAAYVAKDVTWIPQYVFDNFRVGDTPFGVVGGLASLYTYLESKPF